MHLYNVKCILVRPKGIFCQCSNIFLKYTAYIFSKSHICTYSMCFFLEFSNHTACIARFKAVKLLFYQRGKCLITVKCQGTALKILNRKVAKLKVVANGCKIIFYPVNFKSAQPLSNYCHYLATTLYFTTPNF